MALVIGMMACQKDTTIAYPDQETVVTATSTQESKPAPVRNWKVISFTRNDEDITDKFGAFTIQLSIKGLALLTNGNVAFPGTWSMDADFWKFNFAIKEVVDPTGPVPVYQDLKELNGTWTILKTYPSGIVLEMHIDKVYKVLQLENF